MATRCKPILKIVFVGLLLHVFVISYCFAVCVKTAPLQLYGVLLKWHFFNETAYFNDVKIANRVKILNSVKKYVIMAINPIHNV